MLGDAVIIDGNRSLTYTGLSITGIQQDTFLSFTIKQEFVNNSGRKADIIYFMPSEPRFCTYDPTFIVDGKVIKPNLRSKEEAMEEFKEAKRDGYMTMIGQYAGNGLDSFGLGNIEADKKVEIQMKISFLADVHEKGYIYKFPLTHKYQEGRVTYTIPNNFEFSTTIMTTKELRDIHVTANETMNIIDSHNATFVTKIPPKEDAIIIETLIKDEDKSIAVSSDGYISISIYPQFEGKVEQKSEFYFIIDCSGSMSGSRIENAKFCLNILIHSLPIGCRFSIIQFGNSYKEVVSICDYSNKNVKYAMSAIARINADMGGTDILSPLEYVFKKKLGKGFIRKIFLLTDGEVHNSDMICSRVQKERENNRIFAIGLGSGADPGLIKNISAKSGGNYVLIADDDNMNNMIVEIMKSALSPSLSNISIQGESDQTEMWPTPYPPLIARNPQSFFIKSSYIENILICGFNEGEEIGLIIPVTKCNDNLGMKQLFSRYVIDDIETDIFSKISAYRYSLYSRNYHEMIFRFSDRDLRNKCIDLSLSSGVLSQFTSYIGVNYQSDLDMRINYDRYFRGSAKFSIAPDPPNLNPRLLKPKASEPSKKSSPPKYNIKKDESTNDDKTASNFSVLKSIFSFFFPSSGGSSEETSPDKLIFNQNIDGSWDNFVNVDTKIEEKYGRNVAATVAAVSYIRRTFKDDLTQFSLMISKALSFLQNIDKDVDWEDIINK
ncbi:von Willebrand factor type A domain containing protein [Trichomonas vaginalis G3]|uniref:von Willebrand factor type A domain containing protein n=1 Tax=Trichomonas vaginalis (strain ATCC PRA-98 / G3) TaxID=412133 RepID=A2E6Y7_TRIV3|nr:von Willebrand factor A domain-containing protein 5A family [Trichomonas vaginalis G3]EAY11623.1 von Willebrand factor type A domain containing protein [Trichomonas vaginalis G3]KAI5516496.1 von Willebrand factor A domain-containing protein 5A family [Trichomonas vaginalis G3]|eukprot:XP_001323846.1 von Willebrand factor type A domain containing protein [Trichomonas vaginalis G3]